jgi:KDO2-lipid IV(A) lauroyltransferase
MSRGRPKHAIEYALFRLLAGAIRVLPEGWALRAGGALGWFAGVVLRIRRRDVDRHLEIAFPENTPAWRGRTARRCYVHFGRESVAIFRLADVDREDLVARTTVSGLEEVRASLDEGRGAVLVTGHLGNWEIGGAVLSALGLPVDAVAKGMANRRFDADLKETRERLGMRVIDMAVAPRAVLKSLRSGRVVALVADQNAGESGVFVPFFGRAASTARGPALFALRSGAPIVLGTCLRESGWPQRYRLDLKRVEVAPTGDLEGDVVRLTREHTAALEQAVRDAPEQYFWQHKRWKTRPPEEPPSAGGGISEHVQNSGHQGPPPTPSDP